MSGSTSISDTPRIRASGHLVAITATLLLLASQARAQQPAPSVAVEFRAGDDIIRGRFFPTAAPDPVATIVLIPGFGGDTTDVLGLGARLSVRDVNVLIFNNRGVQNSGGTLSYAKSLDDAGAAIALLHAARDTRVRGVLSIAGADHGGYARRVRDEAGYRDAIIRTLTNARAPQGNVRFDPVAIIDDIAAHESEYSHPTHAARFVGRPVLLVGGWDDATCPVEREILPMYRALQGVEGSDASLITYTDGHGFRASRDRMAEDVHAWLVRMMSPAHQGPAAGTTGTEEQRVLAAEDEYVAAELRRDERALRRLVDNRFVYNAADGTTSGKEALIQGVLRMNMVGQEVTERSLLIEGDIALIFGTTELRFADPGKPERVTALRYTSTFANRDGRWRMIALQMQARSQNQ